MALLPRRRAWQATMQMEPFQQQEGGGAFGSEDITIQSGAAFLVGLDIKRDKYKTLVGAAEQGALWTIDDSLDELERLCGTAGLEVRGRDYQSLQNPSPSTFIGSGKVEELGEFAPGAALYRPFARPQRLPPPLVCHTLAAAIVKSLKVETVVFDDELSPAQQRNLQAALGVQVYI